MIRPLSFCVALLTIALSASAATPSPITSKSVVQRTVAVTFDDLPDMTADEDNLAQSQEITSHLVSLLSAYRVPAIGFVNEDKLNDEQEVVDPQRVLLLRSWLDAGLLLGNHTYSHADLSHVPLADYEAEVLKGERVTRPLVEGKGGKIQWFRHPYLDAGHTLADKAAFADFLEAHGYAVAPVTIDSAEWIFGDAYAKTTSRWTRLRLRHAYIRYMEARFAYWEPRSRDLFGHEIPQVLMLHADALNAAAFGSLARMLQRRGYRFVSLAEATSDPAYRSPDHWLGEGVSWIERWGTTRGLNERLYENDPKVPAWVQKLAGETDE